MFCIEWCTISNAEITETSTLFDCSIVLVGESCFRYTALPGFSGLENIIVTGCDGQGNCETITVLVQVGGCDGNIDANNPEVGSEGSTGSETGEQSGTEIPESQLVQTKECELSIANGFTPNGDGVNDVLNITGADCYDSVVWTIFDVTGKIVFKTDDIANLKWNGSIIGNNKNSQEGTYFYIIEAHGIDLHKTSKGFIEVRR